MVLFLCSKYITEEGQRIAGGVLVGTGLWIAVIFVMRNVLKGLLSWHGWMFGRHGSLSLKTKVWLVSESISTAQLKVLLVSFKIRWMEHYYFNLFDLICFSILFWKFGP